jgi:putative membrane protein
VSLFLSGMLLLPGYAQTSKGKSSKEQSNQQQTGAKLTAADRTFLKQAAEGNMAEVQMGQLGQQKGTSAEVKQLAQALATDHQQNQQMLQSLAQKEGVTLRHRSAPKTRLLSIG